MENIGDWARTKYSKELSGADDGSEVVVMGWARAIRGSGNLIFIQLADRYGSSQIIAKKGVASPAIMKKLDGLNRESVIAVKGTVKASKQAPGGYEIVPIDVRVINEAETPLPMEVVTKKTPAELKTRLDARFIDLRKPEVAAIFEVASALKISFLEFFDEQKFVNINPPLIIGAASEGGAELFFVKYFDREAFLAQSPQLYKQMLMATGLDRVSIVTPVFRAEKHDTPRHINEAIQMDIEVAWVKDEEDALVWFDRFMPYAVERVREKCADSLKVLGVDPKPIKAPIKRVTYDEALKVLAKEGIKLKWGEDLTPEAEKKICEVFNPVIIIKWPTVLRAFYSMPDPKNPKVCNAFDLLYNGMELSSGAQRIHVLKDLEAAMKKKGLKPENFKFYLDAFRYGVPPHAGFSIGLERFTMTLLNLGDIKEATMFPRTRERLHP